MRTPRFRRAAARPLVSVVVTNYNYAHYLARAIDSALNQTYRAVEVLVVDDGSTDESRGIIAHYGARIRPVLRANGGNAAAYNSGFAASRGEIVLFLDADDVLYPEAVAAVVTAWRDGTSKAQFYLDCVDAEDRALWRRTPNVPFAEGKELSHLLAYGYYPSPPASGNAYARRVLSRLLPADEAVWRMGIDGYLNAVAALYGRIASIHRPLGAYRHHDRNHSEASGTNLQKIRRDILNEVHREGAIKAHAASLGQAIVHPLSLRIPSHCKGRLLSLKLAPAEHPFPIDRLWRLVAAGIFASWRFPHHGFAKRLSATFAFPALAMLSTRWLASHLDPIIIADPRQFWLRYPHLPPLRGDLPSESSHRAGAL